MTNVFSIVRGNELSQKIFSWVVVLSMVFQQTAFLPVVASAEDDGSEYGGAAFYGSGRSGIRTDFMDVEFDDYLAEELK